MKSKRQSREVNDSGTPDQNSNNKSTLANQAVLRITRHLLAGVIVFLAGAHVNRVDHSLTRLVAKLNSYESEANSEATTGVNNNNNNNSNNNNKTTTYQLAFDQSYGFFDDISESDWHIHQQWARTQIDHRYDFNPKRHYGNPALWYYNNYNPIFSCPHSKRVWGVGDGPKWVCDPHRLIRQAERRRRAAAAAAAAEVADGGPHCLIYSIGSNGNYEFEDGMFGQVGDVCEIHIFDFSNNYSRPENLERNMHFHQWGLQGTQQNRQTNRGEFVNFHEILQRLGHANRTIDIFKIDCEGCEWDTYQDWIDYDLRQVLIETHALPQDPDKGFHYFDSFKNNSLLMYSKEVNGFGDGKFYEFSYVKLHPDFLYPPTALGPEVQ